MKNILLQYKNMCSGFTTLTFLFFISSLSIVNAQSKNITSIKIHENSSIQFNGLGGYQAGKTPEFLFGAVNDFSIKSFFNNSSGNNGFTWGVPGENPIASLSLSSHFATYEYYTASGLFSYGKVEGIPTLGNRRVVSDKNQYPYAINQNSIGVTSLNSDSNFLSFKINDVMKARYNSTINDLGGFFVEYLGIGEDKIIPGTALTVDGRVYISDHMVENERGFLSLDSTNPKLANYLLWVEEGIVTKDLVLSKIEDWPDYVFKEDYKLSKLNELENFINTNGHLPSMPPAKLIEKEGFTAVEMNKNLVKAIEELTLYAIQQDKTIEKQNEVIENLLQRTDQLLKRF